MLTKKIIKEKVRFHHNKEKGICTAYIRSEDLEDIVGTELEYSERLIRKYSDMYVWGVEDFCDNFPKLMSFAKCNYDEGDEYDEWTGEEIAFNRLLKKVDCYLRDFYMNKLEEMSKVVEVMFKRVYWFDSKLGWDYVRQG